MDKKSEISQSSASPYDILKPYGITPHSSMKEIDESAFKIMKRMRLADAGQELQAIQTLKHTTERLVIDFFLTEANTSAEEKECFTPEDLVAQLPPVELPSTQEMLERLELSPEQVAAKKAEKEIEQIKQTLKTASGENKTIEFRAAVALQDLLEEIL